MYLAATRSNRDASDKKCGFQERDMVEFPDCQYGSYRWFYHYACSCFIWRRNQDLSQQLTEFLEEQNIPTISDETGILKTSQILKDFIYSLSFLRSFKVLPGESEKKFPLLKIYGIKST